MILLDQDDKWLPDALEVMMLELEARADLVSAYGLARCIDGDDEPVPGDDLADLMRERPRVPRLASRQQWHPTSQPRSPHSSTTTTRRRLGAQLVRRSVMDRVGPFDPDTVPGDDWDMSLRISRFGPIGFLDRQVLEWRRHPETQSLASPGWRQAYFGVRSKTLRAPENTPEQRRLARIGYLAPGRRLMSSAWSNVHAPPTAGRSTRFGISARHRRALRRSSGLRTG